MIPVTTVGGRTKVSLVLYADSEFRFDPDADHYHIEIDNGGFIISAWINDPQLGLVNVTNLLIGNEKLCNKVHEYWCEVNSDDGDCEMTLAHRESERELEEK